MTDLTTLSIAGLASLVRQDWKKVNYAAEPYRASVAETSRSYLDADLARKFLTEKQLAKITKVCGTVTVRVTARKAA